MQVSIVIRNLNARNTLEEKLPLLFRFIDSNSSFIKEVVVVDDGSTDDSVSFLNKEYKDKVKLIRHTKTRGISASLNIGVRSTTGDFVMVLSPNFLPIFDSLEKVLKIFSDEKVFTISLNQNGVGCVKSRMSNGFIQLFHLNELKTIQQTFYANINGFIFRKKIWQSLGGLDEKLFSPFSWEIADLSYRASKRGYLNLWNPSAVIEGDVVVSETNNYSEKTVEKIKQRNELLMIWKNIHSKSMLEKHISSLFRRIFSEPGCILNIFSALVFINTVLKYRKKEIKEATVSDEAVFSQSQ